jgi:hypothetical protein
MVVHTPVKFLHRTTSVRGGPNELAQYVSQCDHTTWCQVFIANVYLRGSNKKHYRERANMSGYKQGQISQKQVAESLPGANDCAQAYRAPQTESCLVHT